MKSTNQFLVLKNGYQLSYHIGTKRLLMNESHSLINIDSLGQTGPSIFGVVHHVLPD